MRAFPAAPPGTARPLTALALLLLLAACATPPQVSGPTVGARSEAGRRLLLAGTEGPVPLLVDAVPPGVSGSPGTKSLAELASEGVADWVQVDFERAQDAAAVADKLRLELRFVDPVASGPGALCATPLLPSAGVPTSPPRLHAVLCDGGQAIADAAGVAVSSDPDDVARLVRATTRALVPIYQSWGGGLPGVAVFGGVGVGSGSGGGIGVGLGF